MLQVSMYIETARYQLLRAGRQPYVRKYGDRATFLLTTEIICYKIDLKF
jgi:hypothetical protein